MHVFSKLHSKPYHYTYSNYWIWGTFIGIRLLNLSIYGFWPTLCRNFIKTKYVGQRRYISFNLHPWIPDRRQNVRQFWVTRQRQRELHCMLGRLSGLQVKSNLLTKLAKTSNIKQILKQMYIIFVVSLKVYFNYNWTYREWRLDTHCPWLYRDNWK